MDPGSIVSIILIVGLVFERVLKHFKKSKCCGGEMEFNSEASVPDLQNILRK